MAEAESTTFRHSVKVPNQYKKAAKLLENSMVGGKSLKGMIFEEKHAKTNRLYALMVKISKNKHTLDTIIEKSRILEIENRLNKYLCIVLIAELLFGAQKLNGDSKPVECVRSYLDKFNEIMSELKSGGKDNGDSADDTMKPRYVRVNTNVLSRADALEQFRNDGWQEVTEEFASYDDFLKAVDNLGDESFVSDIHVNDLFVFPPSSKRYWALCALVKESKVILQDKASCLPAFLLSPPRGSYVLDMCAAPGMKTSHLTAMMKNRGTVWAVEKNAARYQTLDTFVRKTKCNIVQPINADILSTDYSKFAKAQYILLDPPCSGSGMTNRLNVSMQGSGDTEPDRLYKLGGLQIKMLVHALQNYQNAVKLVYSTCSVYPEENEHVIQRALEMCADTNWKLVKPIEFAEKWKNFGSPKFKHIGKKCLYAKPDVDKTDGFFVAIFERDFENPFKKDGADNAE